MGRPPKGKKTMTLQEFEDLWSKHMNYPKTIPMELTPSFFSYCKSDPTAEYRLYRRRMSQLDELELLETVQIDYYIDWKPKVSFI
jgi:hypothetical protein